MKNKRKNGTKNIKEQKKKLWLGEIDKFFKLIKRRNWKKETNQKNRKDIKKIKFKKETLEKK